MLTTELIEHILGTIPHRTVGVLGDLFLDRYLDIDPALNEPSIETGRTAYQVTRVRAYPGAAGTVVNNLAALGIGRVYPIGYIGDDGEGYELRQALKRLPAVEHGGIFPVPGRRTPTYTKPMLGDQELNRLDIKNRVPTPPGVEDFVIELLDEAWPQLDALLVLDQVSEENCGVVTRRVREHLAGLGEREPDKFVLADSRGRIGLFRNVCVKPNLNEAAAAFEAVCAGPIERYNDGAIAEGLAGRCGRAVFCTIGEDGVLVANPPEGPRYVRTHRVSGRIDIVGAGDSCSAGIACGMVSGLTYEQAAAFGNLVASITIQQIGVTGTATPEQVRARWREVEPR
jgi:bifunctional ADP-heptose synthase (sugar kinase/adenylyltransferase)